MNLPLIIIGAGGHAKVLIDTLKSQTAEILGITEAEAARRNAVVLGVPVIGEDKLVFQYPPASVLLVNGLGRIDGSNHRQEIFQYFKNHGYQFARVIHPSAVVSSYTELSEGVQILAGAVIQAGSFVGPDSIINTGARIDHDNVIGSHVHIAPGVTLSGGVQIDDGALVGSGAVIIQGIHIGANSIVGAGAVVIRDVPQGAKVVGVPAKVVK